MTCVQDEVHRFAISGYRKKHEAASLHSELEEIRGIGPKKRKKLLQTFVSTKRLQQASYEELCEVVDSASAKEIWKFFHGDKNNEE